jgi:[ribosomal protein S5]-alanine N-acetyltransferase
MAPEKIFTERLSLRRPVAADAATIFGRYAGDAEVTRWMAWPRHREVAESVGFVDFSDRQWSGSGVGPYLIESRDDGRLLGCTGIGFESADLASTGYILTRDAWGLGYASEALRAMVRLAGELDVKRFYALCHPDHRASAHVLEKAGFVLEGRLTRYEFPNLQPGVLQDALIYVHPGTTSASAT